MGGNQEQEQRERQAQERRDREARERRDQILSKLHEQAERRERGR